MKKIALIITLVCLFSIGNLAAQEAKQKGQKIEKLKTELKLTDEQAAELKVVFKESRKDLQGIKQNENTSKEDKKAQVKVANEKSDAKIQTILSKEQFVKFNAIKAKKKEESKATKLQEKEAYLDELGVTEAQKSELRKIKESTKANVEKIKNDPNLSDERRKAQIKAYKDGADKSVKEVLTAEQYKAMKDKKKEDRQTKKGKKGAK